MADERLLWRAVNGDSTAEAWAISHPDCWEVAVTVDGQRLFSEVVHRDGDSDQPLDASAQASLAHMRARGWTPMPSE